MATNTKKGTLVDWFNGCLPSKGREFDSPMSLNMKKRRKQHRIRRKDIPAIHSLGEWSRMLHKSWKIDVDLKDKFKKKIKAKDFEDL